MRIIKTLSMALALSVSALMFTSVPAAAAEVPADKYTYSLSGKVGTESKTIQFEGSDAAKAFEVVLVEANAEIKFTPKEKMTARVRAYDPEGFYSGNLMWTIDGSEQAVTEIEANKTATATLVKNYWGLSNPYYVFSFGSADNTTEIVYAISTAAAAPATTTAPTAPVVAVPISAPTTAPVVTTPTPAPATTTPAVAPTVTPAPVTNPAPAATTAPATTTKPAPVATTTPVAESSTYQVQRGDTLGTIALNYYGGYEFHTKIYNANKELFKKSNNRLDVGMNLVLPKEGLLAPIQPKDGESIYTVKAGDTLGGISAKYYGDAGKYTKIYEANKSRIKNPNMIFEGQKLLIVK